MQRYRFLLLIGTMTLLASTAGALPQSSASSGTRTTVRTRCSSCPTARDSSLRNRQARLLLKLDSLRWQIENVHSTDAERARIDREMTLTVAALESSLDETMRADATVATRVMVQAGPTRERMIASGVAVAMGRRTRGYLGVTFDGPSAACDDCKEHIIRFYQYPKIAMVDPDSPAERAGILEGDTLLALNGTDVKNEPISLTKLLIPASRIVVRVRREGDAKNLPVIVGEAPEYYVRRSTPLPARVRVAYPAMPPEPVRVPGEPMPPMSVVPTPRAAGTMWIFNNGVAGARVETISEGLGKALGAKQGVLVIRADPGTPAYRSGLRDGDVVLQADGRSVATVNALRQAVEGAGDEGVKLRVLREKRQRDVTLRW